VFAAYDYRPSQSGGKLPHSKITCSGATMKSTAAVALAHELPLLAVAETIVDNRFPER
jgi:hypothetical protein